MRPDLHFGGDLEGIGLSSQLQVFISSTFEDLKDYRLAVYGSIQTHGDHADDMIYWPAESATATTASLARVASSDLLVLIVGHRYGYVPPGSEESITHLEYRAARDAGVPVLAFFVDNDLPWPPRFIERDHFAKLEAFRREVERDVVRQTFTTPDNLSMKVTHALARFKAHRLTSTARAEVRGPAVSVSSPAELRSSPDTTVEVGRAEDGLPLLVSVKRSGDLKRHFAGLRNEFALTAADVPDSILDTFLRAIEDSAQAGWSKANLRPVCLSEDTEGEMFVSSSNLSTLFRSLLSRLLGIATPSSRRPTVSPGAEISMALPSAHAVLNSVGGRNRFLGIALNDGSCHSVGRNSDGRWVTWRSFFSESLAGFPSARFALAGHSGLLQELPEALIAFAARTHRTQESLQVDVKVSVDREDVARAIVRVACEVAAVHADGRVHGDLKPDNVLLTAEGVRLIDSFELALSDVSPGWTPGWSAPEQLIGNPVGPEADIYPIALMVVRLLGAHLTGEVGIARALDSDGRPRDYRILRDPIPARRQSKAMARPDPEFRAWSGFLAQAMRSDPKKRMSSASEFADQLGELIVAHPLTGSVEVSPLGSLVMAEFPDGSASPARMLEAGRPERFNPPTIQSGLADASGWATW